MVTIRVSLDVPIIFDRMGKTFFPFNPKVTWKNPIFLRTPLNCPHIENRCPQSTQNIFMTKSPINFIQSASEPLIDVLSNAL